MSIVTSCTSKTSEISFLRFVSLVKIYPKSYPSTSLGRLDLLRKSSSCSGPRRFEDTPKFKAFKEKQAKMQCDDGYPIHLKGGVLDKILYHVTVGGVIIGLAQGFWFIYCCATKKAVD